MATDNTIFVQFNPDPSAGWSYSFPGQSTTGQSQVYTLRAWYNHYAGRYYLRATSNGDSFAIPLVSSPDNYDIFLNSGYLSTPIVYRGSTSVLEIG
ncbi:conserved hypothetical protein [Burkholderia cepacia]